MSTKDFKWGDFRKSTTGPHWRHAWALSLTSDVANQNVDPSTRQLYCYRRDYHEDPQGTVARQPLLTAVEELQQHGQLVESLQLLVLAGATSAQIAQRTGLPEEVVTLWQTLYFDVGEFRHAPAWMHGIVWRASQISPRLASRMRLAIGGGLVAVDDLLRAETQTARAEAEQHRDRRLRLSVQVDEAIDQLAQTPSQYLALIKLNLQLRASDKRFELERLKLEQHALRQQERSQKAALQREIEQQPVPGRVNRARPCPNLDGLRWNDATEAANVDQNRAEPQSVPLTMAQPQELSTEKTQMVEVLPYAKEADDQNYQPEVRASFAA